MAQLEQTKDKLLFTPGPLTTSATVKAAMLHDFGSRDDKFMGVVRSIRQKLLELAGQPDVSVYTAILMQGSATFGIQSVISSTLPPAACLLIVVNAAQAKPTAHIPATHKILTHALT